MNSDTILKDLMTTTNSFVDSERYTVLSINEMQHKIGKSVEGYPKVFVRTSTTKKGIQNLNGELFSVEYNVQCSLVDEHNNLTDAVYSIITLRSIDEPLIKIFFDVFIMMLMSLSNTPSDIELATTIEGLLSIFATLKRKPIHKIQGLWAELLVIELSNDPITVAKAWHNSPGSKYDFTIGADKIEVKSTSSEERIHKFSLDQLNPTESSHLLIASAIVRESAKGAFGLSIDDLYKRICNRISDIDIRMHMYTVIINTLGDEYEKSNTVYFDYITGKDSLAFYNSTDIPKIKKEDVPPFVSSVKFDANLTHIDNIRNKGISFKGYPLLGAI